jgi:hypothetical protein
MDSARLKRKLIILGFYADYDGQDTYISAMGADITYRVNTKKLAQYINNNFSLHIFDSHLFFFIISGLKFILVKAILFFPLCFFLMFLFTIFHGNLTELLDELKNPLIFLKICEFIFIFEACIACFYFSLVIFNTPFYLSYPVFNPAKPSIFKWLDSNQL